LHHPQVLFLDEPTLGLDAQTRNLLWNYVQQLNDKEGMTIFFTTHYLAEAEAIANRIAIIDHGKIVAMGNTEELKAQTNTENLEEAYLELTGKRCAMKRSTLPQEERKRSGNTLRRGDGDAYAACHSSIARNLRVLNPEISHFTSFRSK
jgi:ABC-2 type transport system ATP-binding protein